ncbi:MAG: hypothetical protein QM765_51505 [Myxococcales bacterium]
MRVPFAIAAFLAAQFVALPAKAAPLQGSLTASFGPGLDTNPSKTLTSDASVLDGFLGLSATGRVKVGFGEGQQVSGRYDLGLRKFFLSEGEDLAVQQVALDWAVNLGRVMLGAEASGKWWVSRAGTRDYADLGADLFVDIALVKALNLRLAGGARGFLYPPAYANEPVEISDTSVDANKAYDWAGPQGSAMLRWQPARRHTLALALFGVLPYYNGFSRYEGSSEFANGRDGYPVVKRRDAQFGGQLSYSFRGPVAVQAGYSYVRINSTSYGEASERHRAFAAVSAKLPWRLYAGLLAAYQFSSYPDGIFLSRNIELLDDDSFSSVGAKVGLAITDEVDLELRYATYWTELPPSSSLPTTWWRHTAFLGVTLRL